MLRHLSIQNYALIDLLEIDFFEGFSIITGETGAGKSILLGALGLIVGQRADTQVLQDKSKKCIVEGTFEINAYQLQAFFTKNDLDYAATAIIRREINPAGNSRAFINDTPVNLGLLKELGLSLIDIHSQHETLLLNDSIYQLSVVDAFAQHPDLITDYQKIFKTYKAAEKSLADLLEKEKQSKTDQDYFQFQFEELDSAVLKQGEQEEAEQELEILNNSEEIKSVLNNTSIAFSEGEMNIIAQIAEIKLKLSQAGKYAPSVEALSNRLNSAFLELKDIAGEIEKIEEEIIYDPARIEELSNRLNLVNHLQQKHRVKTVGELVEIREQISQKLLSITTLEADISKLYNELEIQKQLLLKLSGKLSQNRSKAVSKIEKQLKKLLEQLGMPNASVVIEQKTLADFNESGNDKIRFLFSGNTGAEFKELNKVASGGELSRLMLSIKSPVAELKALPTMIFDEIDTGVSGDIADKVGNIMKQMAKKMQVIAITHLPQIASKGDHHFMVYKQTDKTSTRSAIKQLDADERVREIAKMLSGEQLTKAAIENAKELLSN